MHEQGIRIRVKAHGGRVHKDALLCTTLKSHLQSTPALQTETFLRANKEIYMGINILTHQGLDKSDA